ncbi:MAG: hypothetical protein ACOC2M_01745 [bacterium]
MEFKDFSHDAKLFAVKYKKQLIFGVGLFLLVVVIFKGGGDKEEENYVLESRQIEQSQKSDTASEKTSSKEEKKITGGADGGWEQHGRNVADTVKGMNEGIVEPGAKFLEEVVTGIGKGITEREKELEE